MKFTSLSFIFLLLSFINIEGKSKPDPKAKTLLVETKDEGGDNSNDYSAGNNYEGNGNNDDYQFFDGPTRDYSVGPSIPPENKSSTPTPRERYNYWILTNLG